ncbi:MAG TPA: hemerythrin domain-containing protein, partial [Croceibacterium sp.]|nr:hemerythrin domain-containing protein [Croceibacterium sp.]
MPKEQFTDAIMLLKNDHRTVEDLFSKFQKASGKDRKWQLAQQICNELKIHAMIEEEIFYPACQSAVED